MKINEITYSSGIQTLSSILNIQQSSKIGHVENLEVYEQDLGNGICYFLYDNKNTKYLSYVATDGKTSSGYVHLNQIENVSNEKGALSSLLFFLTKNKKIKFYIDKEDPLTLSGLRWIISAISSNRNLFTIMDETGSIPKIERLQQEWNSSQQDPSHSGTMSIFIESIVNDNYNNIFEHTDGLLIPMYRIFKDANLE